MFPHTLTRALFALPLFVAMLGLQPASADAFRPKPKSPLLRPERPDLFLPKKQVSPDFTPYEEREKRFTLMYEDGLEKREPPTASMAEAREALGRVEARMGPFTSKFKLVVVTELSGNKDPYVAIGTFGKDPAVLVTFNGTVTPVIAHGMGMLRIEELKTKAPVWLRHGGARIFVRADGFDKRLFTVLDEKEGPAAYKDADAWMKGKHTDDGDKLHALATGWMLVYYCTEVCPKRLTVEEVMNLKDADRPDPETAWKAVKDKHSKMEKKGK